MRDVAALVGVSKQTVSAVINDKPGITEETRARVLAAIERLRYRPDHTARSLRSGKTGTLALFVSDVSNSVLGRMASAAENYAHSVNYNLILYNTHDDAEREMAYVNTVAHRSVDGVLFVAATEPHRGHEILEAVGIPSVTVDRVPEGYDGASIALDNLKAGRLAAEHLLELGHTRLVHLAGPFGLRLARERQRGFVEALQRADRRAEVDVEAAAGWGCQPGYEAMQRLLKRCPRLTALFAATDHSAIGAMHAIREAGLRIPGDVSVIGLDNIEMAAFVDPPLTTIRQFLPQMATLGVQMLIDILDGKGLSQQHVVIEPTLVVRQSTAPPDRA